MAKHRVSALILDEHNLDEMARPGVSAAEVVQVIANRHISAPNPRSEERSILLIGDSAGDLRHTSAWRSNWQATRTAGSPGTSTPT